MNTYSIFHLLLILCVLGSCQHKETPTPTIPSEQFASKNLLRDVAPTNADASINAVIEIPAGTTAKWEVNKKTGTIEWEMVNDTPRVVNYMGYPGNYGFIPRTLLPLDKGGDGDPLDIILLGSTSQRGKILPCKILGVLYLDDTGEQDDKIIAVAKGSTMYDVNNLDELNSKYVGVLDIVQTWFINYKGPNRLVSKGFGDTSTANALVQTAIREYQAAEVD